VEGLVHRLPDTVELAFYRIIQEALSNIRKHSQAQQTTVLLQFGDQEVILKIEDNGIGFEIPPLHQLPVIKHYGLLGIQERTQLIGGQLDIQSQIGQGTVLIIRWPITENIGIAMPVSQR
jgi:two-component system sensor histidine kinase DegS